jgi:hypothetical protein
MYASDQPGQTRLHKRELNRQILIEVKIESCLKFKVDLPEVKCLNFLNESALTIYITLQFFKSTLFYRILLI